MEEELSLLLMNKYIELKWDTDFFGFRVAKLIPENISTNEFGGILNSLKRNSFRLVYLFSDPADVSINLSASKNKGYLADKKVTYFINLNGDFSEKININISEYYKQNGQLDNQIINLALQAGAYSRFKRDPNISLDLFIKLYSIWAENSLNGEIADKVFVYKSENRIKGFVTIRIKDRIGEIGLIGVDEKERGNNIGSELIKAVKVFFYKHNIFEINVVTQKENVLACKFYKKNKFSVKKIENVFHFWL